MRFYGALELCLSVNVYVTQAQVVVLLLTTFQEFSIGHQ